MQKNASADRHNPEEVTADHVARRSARSSNLSRTPWDMPRRSTGRLQAAAAAALGAALVAVGGWYVDPAPVPAASDQPMPMVVAAPEVAPVQTPVAEPEPVVQGVFAAAQERTEVAPADAIQQVAELADLAGVFENLIPAQPPAEPELPPVVMVDPFAEQTAPPTHAGTALSDDDVQFVDAYGTGDIHVSDAPLQQVLRMLSQQTQLNIIAHKGVEGSVTANLYGVTVHEALDAILMSNGFGYREDGNFIHVHTLEDLEAVQAADRATETRVYRLFHLNAADATSLIAPVLSEQAIVGTTVEAQSGLTESGTGGTGGQDYAGEDLVVITDYADRLDRVRQILDEADRRPPQILIEATILRAALSEDNQLGIDFNVLGGVDFTDVSFSGGQINGAGVADGQSPDAFSGGTGNSFSGSVPGGLRLGVVTGDVSLFISALEGVTDTVVMANPKVLAVNRQEGRILVGRQDGYITTTVSETVATQTVQFLETGTKLMFRPFVTGDGYVRLEVHPEDSDGGLNADNLPFKITTEVTTNAVVKDGHTVVIGGLFRETSTSTRSQVPGLGNLPVVGAAFRNQADRTVREEIVILLTPHIIKDDDKYSELSEEQLAAGEKLRVGVREGMMPWGRERLAEGFYEKALTELRKESPDRKKALFNLNAALNLNPKFLEAIELKEELTGDLVQGVDNSSIRGFVRRSMLSGGTGMSPADRPKALRITPTTETVSEEPEDEPTESAPLVAAPVTPLPMKEVSAEDAPTTRPDGSWDEMFAETPIGTIDE
jgi:type IV pilus assembly protein PilQ